MKIFKRKNIRTWYVWVNRKQVSLGTSDEKVAKQLAAEMELQKLRGTLGLVCSQCNGSIHQQNNVGQVHVVRPNNNDGHKDSIDQFHNRYLRWREEDGTSSYLKSQRMIITKHWAPFLKKRGIEFLNQITAKIAQDFISQLKDLDKSPKTITGYFSIVDLSLHQAVAWGHLETNPFHSGGRKLVTLPKINGTQCKPRILSNEELALLFTHKTYGQYYEWLYYTGQRAGDVSALVYENIDPVKRELRLWIEKGDRYQTLALHQHLADQVAAKKTKKGPLFPTLFDLDKKKRSNKFTKVRKALQKTLTDNGFTLVNDEGDKAKLHSLRATAAQSVQLNGGNRKDAAKHLGHSSDKTIDEYIHQDTRVGNAMLDKIPVIKPEGVA